jgi:prolyl-tRNA synthetase
MLQSKIFTKVSKNKLTEDLSTNAALLEKGGFIYKNSAGVYTYLPLGWRVIQKISQIIKEEMNAIGGQEMLMAALHDKHYLQATGRWDVDVVFKVISGKDKEPSFNISWTHEEIITEIASKFVNSYKDLPFSAYQIQTKFRHEPRAKSGLLRGREFIMKDLYSFHTDEKDLLDFYNKVAEAYQKIFQRCGLKSIRTLAAGGDFTINNTDEFQVVAEVGEDTIFLCDACGYAVNQEIAEASKAGQGILCPKCKKGKFKKEKSIEVGNIFPLGTKYSEAFNLNYTDQQGKKQPVVMGSYGIGLGRVMGTVVEIYNDEKGIIWPENIAPFKLHIIPLQTKDAESQKNIKAEAAKLYKALQKQGLEVLLDDREESAGVKFGDSDLIGIPYRIVISEKTLKDASVELKKRGEEKQKLVKTNKIVEELAKI